jgi:hypothetical protein
METDNCSPSVSQMRRAIYIPIFFGAEWADKPDLSKQVAVTLLR